MANIIQTKTDSRTAMTITVDSLTNGSSRQSTMVDNSTLNRPGAIVFVRLQSGGTGPTAGSTYDVFLLRGDGTNRTDGAGASDAAITIENAPLLGSIVLTNSTNKDFYGEFDTGVLGPLGPSWGIAVKNNSGQTLHAATSTSVIAYMTYYPEIQ